MIANQKIMPVTMKSLLHVLELNCMRALSLLRAMERQYSGSMSGIEPL
jgi:hypothetical protein